MPASPAAASCAACTRRATAEPHSSSTGFAAAGMAGKGWRTARRKPMSAAIVPAPIAVPQKELDDLRARLALTRWPHKEPVADWSQGAPLAKVSALVDYWAH